MFKAFDNKVIRIDERAKKTMINLFKNKKSRNLTFVPNIRATGEPNFLILNAKKVFNHLQLMLIRTLILQHFDLENHIQIKINALGYAIGGVLSQLNLASNTLLNNSNDSNLNK